MIYAQPTNYIFRTGKNSSHLWGSCVYNIWGINSSTSGSKNFLKNVKPGDCLWFVQGNSGGLIVAVAIYEHFTKRVDGMCMPFEKLGWTNIPGSWDTDIHFKNFKKIEHMNLLTKIKSPANPRVYNYNCLVNLPEMYTQIYCIEEESEKVVNFNVRKEVFDGTSYLVTTNGDIQDEQIKRFVAALISQPTNKEDDEEEEEYDEEEEENEEKKYLQQVLDTSLKISDDITRLISSLNNRLDRL
jgi:hypothetical protein